MTGRGQRRPGHESISPPLSHGTSIRAFIRYPRPVIEGGRVLERRMACSIRWYRPAESVRAAREHEVDRQRVVDLFLGAIAGAVVGLVCGTVLNDPATTLWQRLRSDTYELPSEEYEVRATSTLPADLSCVVANCTYVAENMSDSRLSSAWSSAGSGVGSVITLDFLGTERDVRRLRFHPGWHDGDSCRLRRNGRPSQLRILDEAGALVAVAELEDPVAGSAATTVQVDEVITRLEIEITAVHEGARCNDREPSADTLISEVEVLVVP